MGVSKEPPVLWASGSVPKYSMPRGVITYTCVLLASV